MPVSIWCNTIAIPDRCEAIGAAVLNGIGQRPENEQWTVSIYEPADRPDYIVKIEGPDGFKWKRGFFYEEQTPESIQAAVAKATHST